MASSPRVTFLDFARGFSMIAVVLYHTLQQAAEGPLAVAIRFGGSGVHAFLFLSGFGLMTSSLRQPDLKGFYTRRFKRVLLPYYLFVTLIAFANLFAPIYVGDGLYAYLGHIFLFRMFDESIIGSLGYHLWFISTIIQFYLIYPLLFRSYQRWGARALLAGSLVISIAFGCLTIYLGRTEYRIYNSCALMFLWEFVLGMLAAERYVNRAEAFWEVSWTRLLCFTVVGLVADVGLALTSGPVGQLLNNPAALAAFGGLVIIAYRLTQNWRLVGFERALLWFAGVSYEIYLVHGVIVTRLYFFTSHSTLLQKTLILGVAFLLSLVAGELYQRFLSATLFRNKVRTAAG